MENLKMNKFILFIIHTSLGVGPLLFLGVILFLSTQGERSVNVPDDMTSLLGKISIGILVAAIAISRFIDKLINKKIEGKDNETKIMIYQKFHIPRMAIMQGPALLALVGIFLYTADGGSVFNTSVTFYNLFSFLVYITVWIALFPTSAKLNSILQLKD